ncbi:MAG: helix-turn-helix domain-containing protein [Rhodobacteraceae bacterium]|nr:helix-turn-helix domain-containing protein [Paracoccaceae bacterium]
MRDASLAEIRELALFRDIGEATFEALTRSAYHQTFPPQVTLIHQGQSADFFHVVTDGLVELVGNWNGRENTMVVLRPVSTFTLAACMTDAPYLMAARTIEQSRVILIPSSDLRAAFAADTAFALAIAHELANCYRGMVRHAKDMKLRTSRERLAGYILRQSALRGGASRFELPLEKRLLASFLGMTPENLSRALRALRDDGLAIDATHVTIADRAALDRVAHVTPLIDGPEPGAPDR